MVANDPIPVNLALLVLRLAVGLTMVAHGWNHFFGGGKIEGTGRWFASLGMRQPLFNAYMASLGEIGGGLLLAAGLIAPAGSAISIAVLLGAVFTVHAKNGFFILNEGWEYVVNLMIAALVIAILGAGEWSIDNVIGIAGDIDGWIGAAIAVFGGILTMGQLAMFWRPDAPEKESAG